MQTINSQKANKPILNKAPYNDFLKVHSAHFLLRLYMRSSDKVCSVTPTYVLINVKHSNDKSKFIFHQNQYFKLSQPQG